MNDMRAAARDATASTPHLLPSWHDRFPPISYWVKVGALILAIVIAVRMLAILQGLLIVLAASVVLAIGMQPAIAWLERRGVPRGAALTLILVAGLLVVVGAAVLIIPAVVQQVSTLADTLPEHIERLEETSPIIADITGRLEALDPGEAMGQLPDGALTAVGGAFSSLFDLVLVLTLTPYFAMSLPSVKRWAVRLLVRDDREGFLRMLNRSTTLMANYIVGNLVVSVIAGLVAFVGLRLIGVPYAAALAVFVAVMDVVPAIGATLGAAAVVAVAATEGLVQAIAAGMLVLVYQQVENFVIVPRVMRDAIDVKPASGIVALLVGATLAGPVGALLALPVAAMLKLVLAEFVLADRIRAVQAADAEDMRERQHGGRPRRVRRRALP